MLITLITGGIFGIMLVLLSAIVAAHRYKNKTPYGYNSEKLQQLNGAQSNFLDYAPTALILIGFLEAHQAPFMPLAGCALALVIGRIIHAVNILSANGGKTYFRATAMLLTFIPLVILAATCFWVVYKILLIQGVI